MYKTNNILEIIEILKKDSPKTQSEIHNLMDDIDHNLMDDIDRKVLHRNLKRLMENKTIGSIRKNNLDIKSFFYYLRGDRLWGKAQLFYFYTSLSWKLYKRLIRDYSQEGKNDYLINEIVNLYRVIETMSLNQKTRFENKTLLKRIRKAKGVDFDDQTINKKIKKAKRDVNWFYRTKKDRIIKNLKNASLVTIQEKEYFLFNGNLYELEKLTKFYDILKMTPYMLWSSSIDENLKNITNPMMDKMGILFTRVFIDVNKGFQ